MSAPAATVDQRELDRFRATLQSYFEWNKRGVGPLTEKRGKSLQLRLYRLFREAAPERGQIRAEALARGTLRRRRRRDGSVVDWAATVRMRESARGFVSLSFLHRAWRAAKEGQSAELSAKNVTSIEIGTVRLRTTAGELRPSVTLTSLLHAAAKLQARDGLANRALADETADMQAYIARKQQQMLERLRAARPPNSDL